MTAGDLFESLTDRLTGTQPVEDVYSAIGIVSDYLATRLFALGSKLLRQEIQLTFDTGVNTAAFPANMIGTVEPPFALGVSGLKSGPDLEPLPRGLRSTYSGRTGRPDYFEIIGNSLVLYPTPEKAYAVTFEASMYPVKPVISSDAIPFNGLFDFIFREVVILVMLQGGGAVLQADGFLTKTLDGIDRNRSTRKVGYRYFV